MNNKEFIQALNEAAQRHPNIKNNHSKIAELSDVPQPTVTRILNADGDPRLSNVLSIASVCGLDFRVDSKAIKMVGGLPDIGKLAAILDVLDEAFPKDGPYRPGSADKAIIIRRLYSLPENADYKAELAEIIVLSEAVRRK